MKPVEGFPAGRVRSVSYVCWSCVEVEAWAMKDTYRSAEKRRSTFLEGGVLVRRCTKCKVVKPLVENFHAHRRELDGSVATPSDYNYECAPCAKATCAAINAKRRVGPERKAILKRKAAQARARRQTPEGKAKHSASQKRYLERVKADPVKRAEYAERQRIDYRMRRERRTGKPVERSFRKVLKVESAPSYLPSAPLAALVTRLVDQSKAISEVLDDRENGGHIGEVCARLGVNERTYRGWRVGEYPKVRIGMAEKVLMNAGVEWFEVYSYDDHAAQFLATEVEA